MQNYRKTSQTDSFPSKKEPENRGSEKIFRDFLSGNRNIYSGQQL